MDALRLAPTLSVENDHLLGQTGWFARLLSLFSFARTVDVDRSNRVITISTVKIWFLRETRTLRFDEVSRIVCRGQGIPTLLPWRYLSLGDSDGYESAFFLISLVLKNHDEVQLFTVWEQQPRTNDWLDRLAGGAQGACRVGDEASVSIIDLLREYVSVPIARH